MLPLLPGTRAPGAAEPILIGEIDSRTGMTMGAYLPEARGRAAAAQALVGGLFPALADRRDAAVHELSAGEQQMVAVGRTLMASDAGRILVTGTGPELLDNPDVHRTLPDLGREASA